MPKWTEDQQKAIESRNGTILVSAAAGSGKTTVLVERVIQRLEDEINPCPADRLLIVTFTKAATAQMKDKIASALNKRLESDPENEHLLRQKMLLPFANISTIDSFCSQLVRENFQQLGISPDFKLLEQNQLSLMMSDAVNKVIEEAYKENSPEFRVLLDLFVSSGNDSKLSEIILSLYKNSRAFPYSEKWLDSLAESYNGCTGVKGSIWGNNICGHIRLMIDYCLQASESTLSLLKQESEKTGKKYEPLFNSYSEYFKNYLAVIDEGNWDEICNYSKQFESGRIPSTDSSYAYLAKDIKSEIVDIMTKRLPRILCCNEKEFLDDVSCFLPVVKKLINLVKDFTRELNSIKKLADGADFSDVVDYALKLLVEDVDEDGNPVKTLYAQELSEQFVEILVDEFQDINETQNLLFKALSNNQNNLFMVGDVKQSIYRFRQAMPDIFLNTRKKLEPYVDGNYPAKINLDYNFRSRQGVTDYINFVFSNLLSTVAGDLDYDESEKLKAKAEYPSKDCADTEIHIVYDSFSKVNRTSEASYIADYIKKTVSSGLMIKDGDIQRKVRYSDFCILLRSTKNKAEIYSGVLTEKGIPCYVSSSDGFFDTTEVKTAVAMLKAVDNPQQDIPLVTAMLSPSFGFTPDELAKLRIDSRKTSYYACVKAAADNGNKKCIDFIACLGRLRTLSATLGSGEFVRELYNITGYDSLVCAMKNGSQRRANLMLLLDYASKYEQAGYTGISGFLRFVDKVEKQQGNLETANEISESANVVRIMSIHKSKGLEFPVCILADCSSRFNDNFLRGTEIFNPTSGIAFKRIESYRKFETLPYKAVQLDETRAVRSEELRVLYVAMTRAKERLVCVIRENNPERKLAQLPLSHIASHPIHPYKVINSGSLADWILIASANHPDFAPKIGKMPFIDFSPKSKLSVILADAFSNTDPHQKDEKEILPDKKLADVLKERLSYKYPYGDLSDIVAKVSPSQLESNDSFEYFASSRPDFAYDDGMNSASIGTAVHKFMEFYDYSSDLGVKEQAQQMIKNKKLSEKEESVLDYDVLSRFFESDTAKEIAASDEILREKLVTFTVPASEIYPDICEMAADEPILVQGYIDCAFLREGKWIIVDYKTDKVKDIEALRSRYYRQLKMYERALAECTGIPVSCTIIYSLHLGSKLEI